MKTDKSQQLFERALLSIPGGVNSPVRAWRGVGGTPRFIVRGQGSRIFDADGNEYIDYIGSWGPLLLGHRHPEIIEAVDKALEARHQLRRAYRTRDRTRRNHPGAGPFDGNGSTGQLRHRSHNERAACCPRLHRPRHYHQIRRLLPRPCRFAAGESRLRQWRRWACPIRLAFPKASATPPSRCLSTTSKPLRGLPRRMAPKSPP